MDVIIRQSESARDFLLLGSCILDSPSLFAAPFITQCASFIFWMFLRKFLYLAERELLDRPSGRRPDYISCSAQWTFSQIDEQRWKREREREREKGRGEKDEHPSPYFAPYRSRWLGLISKNNMRTDGAPPLAKPSGGAKYRWGTLTFFFFFFFKFFSKEWEANKNKRKRKTFPLFCYLFVCFFFTGNQFLLVVSRKRQ